MIQKFTFKFDADLGSYNSTVIVEAESEDEARDTAGEIFRESVEVDIQELSVVCEDSEKQKALDLSKLATWNKSVEQFNAGATP